jgi:hypothetical protein
VEKSSRIGAVDRTLTWIKASAEEGCEGCRIAQCAVQKYCETWIPPSRREFLTKQFTDLWSEYDLRIQIFSESELYVKLLAGFCHSGIAGTLEVFTEPGKLLG